MKIVAVILNAVLLVFTFLVILTDGFPREAAYIAFTLWELGTLVLSASAILLTGAAGSRLELSRKGTVAAGPEKPAGRPLAGAWMRIPAMISNVVLFGFVCWAFVDQYPHPDEDGFVSFVVMLLSVPILNVVVLLLHCRRTWPGFHPKEQSA